MRFLSLSFCPEPLLFWEDVERLASLERARLRDPEADPEASARGLSEAAERIYRRYVAEDAEALINLPSHISGPLHAASASGGAAPSSASVFRSAQRDARHLILTDPFPRSLRSQVFADMQSELLRRDGALSQVAALQ